MPPENDPKGASTRSSWPPSPRPSTLDAELLGDVLDALDEVVLVFDPQGRILFRNRAARALSDMVSSLAPLAHDALGQRETLGLRLRMGLRDLSIVARPLEGRGALLIAREVAPERAGEATLFQSEKLASLGLLSAGIGHEINNPAAFVLANLRALSEQIEAFTERAPLAMSDARGEPTPFASNEGALDAFIDAARVTIAESIEGMSRIHAIARELRAQTRGDDAVATLVDVNAAVESALLMLRGELRDSVRVERHLGAKQRVRSTPSRIGQVFLNLILNAAQALDGAPLESSRIQVRSFDQGGDVVVEVWDSGPGIAPTILPRIFDPLFTTKPVGVGTGLGLPIAREIVRAAGGELSAESVPGSGATFRVRLPVSLDAPEPATAELERSPAPLRRARVLAVDDESLLLAAYKRLMRRHHELETAPGGQAALALLEKDRAFDVILCDLLMPTFSGMDLYSEATARWPELAPRFVFLTGGAYTQSTRRFLDACGAACIEKPVDVSLLLQVIAAHLPR
jgi:signal transduction histidine kinase